MDALKQYATDKTRETIRSLPSGDFESIEHLDDGSILRANICVKNGRIDIDFCGTSDVHSGNLNATPAIVNSVVMYVLRVLIDEPLPLNEGILALIDLDLPTSLLNPDFVDDPRECPAVVGGNVETSQRLTDTLLKPFKRVACSEGTMNNIIFGNETFGYYETVGGGTGAGPDFDGADAVHHHMTNTRATDPEVFEYRYPVRLDRYAIREGSGGRGAHDGGDGIVREMTFLEPVSLSVLTQHRTEEPYGLCGGGAGHNGEQWVVRQSGLKEKLDSVDGCELKAGDRFIMRTPGGGGFGASDSEETQGKRKPH
jgi:5-oxoprolinase (ATP-hydrolysing)